MKERRLYLGIDTSNYKTSLAVIDDGAGLVFEKSELLEVKKGDRGLRQSEAFYQHSMRLPAFIEEALKAAGDLRISAIGYSSRPRRQEGSYMPCFNAGINTALTLSAALRIPAYPFSHQEGHAAAVIPPEFTGRCIFMHLSGGTTEFLLCEPDKDGFDMRIVGGTKDISFGQLLDRAGVALGYPFPAGRYLDELAFDHISESTAEGIALPKLKLSDGYFNLSGAETKLLRHIEEKGLTAETGQLTASAAASILRYISDILTDSAEYLTDKYDVSTVYMAGGVASSKTVRELINKRCSANVLFGDPHLSGDNAVGTAALAKRIHNHQ